MKLKKPDWPLIGLIAICGLLILLLACGIWGAVELINLIETHGLKTIFEGVWEGTGGL